MSSKLSQRLLSLLFIPILIVMVGCGGKNGGTAVEIPPTVDSGLVSDGSFEFGSDAWTGNATNLQPEPGNETNTVNFADVALAGQPFNVNLSQVLPIIQGKRYELTFRARTTAIAAADSGEAFAARTAETRTIFVGIGLNEAPFTNTAVEITISSEWQTFTVTLDAATFGSEIARILFDMGADTGVVILDDVILKLIGDIPASPAFEGGTLTNGDFESEGAWTGNAFNIEEIDGNRVNSANVEVAGNPFDVNLSQAIAIEQGKTFKLTFKARTDGSRSLLAGIGLNEGDFTNDSKEVTLTSEWQTFEVELSSANFGSANSRVLFDMGADTGLVLIDDVLLEEVGGTDGGTGGDTGGDGGVDTGTFDDGLLTNGSFESGISSWTGNAANVTDELLGFNGSKANFANVETAGEAFNVNLSQVVGLVQGETYTLTFKAKSDGERSILAGIGLNEEPFTNNAQSVDLTTEWRTFTLTLPASDFGGANSRVLFDMGAETGVVIIDEVKLEGLAGEVITPTEPTTPVTPPVTPPVAGCDASVAFDDGLLTNGDFEAGATSWIGIAANVTEELLGCNASKANFANIETLPANIYDVNLSQVVAIMAGETYTLTFKAKSDRNRTLLAGIGLNEGDFANNAQTVNLTADWQTYTLTLLADGFGSANSRVLFDMGAELGVIIIDEVSLVSGGGTTPPPVATSLTLTVSAIGATEVRMTGEFWGWDPVGGPIAVSNGDGTWTVTLDPVPTADMQYLWLADGVQENLLDNNPQDLSCTPITDGSGYANRLWTLGAANVEDDIYDACSNSTPPPPPASSLTLTVAAAGATEVRMTGEFWGWDPVGGPIAVSNGDGTWTVTLDPVPTADMQYLWLADGVQENLLDNNPQDLSCTPITDGSGYANRLWTLGAANVIDDIYDSCSAVTPPPPATADLTTNGNFEAGDLSGWTVNDPINITADSTQSSGSTWSGHLVAAPGTGKALSQANLAVGVVNPGDTIDISFDMCGTAADGGIVFPALLSEFGGGNGADRQNLDTIAVPPSVWTRYNYSATAGSNVDGGITVQLDAVCGANATCIADVYFDNVSVTIGGGPVAGSASGLSCAVTTPPPPSGTEPTTAAPAPTEAAADVMSIFSNVYGNAAGLDTNPNWGQGTVSTVVTIAGDETLKYAGLNYQGTLYSALDVSGMDTFHFDYWTADSTGFNAFVIKAGGPEAAYPVTPVIGSWQSVEVPLTAFGGVDLTGVDQLKFDGNGTIFLDNIYFSSSTATPPATEPTTAAPAPTEAAADVMSIFSNVYGNAAGIDTNPNWGQGTVSTVVSIAGDETLKYAGLNYQGTLYSALDVSGMDTFHFDYWTADSTGFNAFVIKAGGPEVAYPLTPVIGSWQSVEVPLTAFGGVDLTGVDQLKFDGNGTIFLDNIYFSSSTATPPATEPATAAPAPTEAAADVMSIFSNVYGNAAGLDTNPNWGQGTVSTVVTIAGDETLKYAGLNYQGTLYSALDVSGMDTFHFDYWTADSTGFNAFVIKAGGPEAAYPVTPVIGSWQSVEVPLTAFGGVDLTGIDQLKFDGNGTIFLDNIYFSNSGVTPPPPAPAGELAVNGDLETGDLSGWALYNNLPTITTDSASGTYAANLVAGEAQLSVLKQERIASGTVVTGQTLNISFKMKGTAGAGGVMNPKLVLEDDVNGATGIVLETIAVPTAGYTTYTYSQAVSGAVANGISLEFAAACGAVAGCNINVFIDDVTITIQ